MEENIIKLLDHVTTPVEFTKIQHMYDKGDYNNIRAIISQKASNYEERSNDIICKKGYNMKHNVNLIKTRSIINKIEDYFINKIEENDERTGI